MTAAMKLKDACYLEEKPGTTYLCPGASRVSDWGSATQLPGPWTSLSPSPSIWFAQPQPLTPDQQTSQWFGESPTPCLVSLETGQEHCQLSFAVFPSEPKAGAWGEWGAMVQGAGEVQRSRR